MKPVILAVGLSFLMLMSQNAAAVEKGDKAPSFEARDDTGKVWKSQDHLGNDKIVVVYFYPADLTGGCTKQACGFRDDMQALADKGVEVVGVSGDSVENHQLFKQEKHLNFTLLADEKGKLAKAFGVPVRKGGVYKYKAGGKEHSLMTGVRAARWTFVIDKHGTIVLKNTQVNAAEDSKAILSLVESLK